MSAKERTLTPNEMLVLLAILRRVRDSYGVTIRNEIESETGQKISFGVLYTILLRLQQEGLLSSRDGESTPERGGRAKRYFSLTGKGQRVLHQTLQGIDRLRGVVHGELFVGALL